MAIFSKENKETKETKGNDALKAVGVLFREKGYHQTTVEDIVAKTGMTTEEFHRKYIGKESLLEELVTNWTNAVLDDVHQVVERTDLRALDKLEEFFMTFAKHIDPKFVLNVGTTLWSEPYTVLRERIVQRNISLFAPLVGKILRQGMEEGVFSTVYPEEAAEMMMIMSKGLKERTTNQVLDMSKPEITPEMQRRFRFYTETVERMIGAPMGSINKILTTVMMKIMPKIPLGRTGTTG